ncbi:YALI0F29865p [Yarrowia lipolytica CLIB122]|uniref:YALI0F29865p n=2 Tax=Yarrowia lipolytica TaxID=4952 RepID=Q6BZY7_YARLI|nr:YALI0F29865p [Yarrowia lipolytica CLIB122]AOW07880.1 hypothetical protein YALI1_F37400g [Yarrowia lipolytica]KAB8282271.1 hypothetical protein BKA91DRAFT_138689 [Yarrowia lipolytica]KAE8172343.1 hypothetical protein BKA90DRAFT_137635 [Yarrowia lipolytica]KAJ8055084.1 hypothetical protein LXG23DRAFT_18566 [Yarrowia lipolytica]RMI99863.1 hypothetical protein BD777DRAFT_122402 [Yarrowia lipolytica]|eukprot:XP_506025.1 YALI0F29865p [Yarrowia lipolytica CLIB122]
MSLPQNIPAAPGNENTPPRKRPSGTRKSSGTHSPQTYSPNYSPQGYTLCSNGWNSTSLPSTSYQALAEQLEIERTESDRIQRQVVELRAKCEKLQDAQVHNEATITARDLRVEELEQQYKRACEHRRNAEESLLGEQQLFITEKHQLFIKQSELEETISHLNKKLKAKDVELGEYQERESANASNSQASMAEAAKKEAEAAAQAAHARETALQKTVERLKQSITVLETSSEQIGLDFASKATAFDEEMRSLKEINNGLVEENEKLQMLVAEKMINGGLSLSNELEMALAEEDESEEDEEENECVVDQSNNQANEKIGDDEDEPAYTESTVSVTEYEKIRKELAKMRLEYRSLYATNEGLVSYVERMLNRLLEYEDFRDGVQKSTKIDAAKVGAFSRRVSSRGGPGSALEDYSLRVAKRGERRGGGSGANDNASIHSRDSTSSYNPLSTNLWSSALFKGGRKVSSGGAPARNVSLGIDGVETNSAANSAAPSTSTAEDCMSLKSDVSVSTSANGEDGDVCSPTASRKSSSQSQKGGLKPLNLRKNSGGTEHKKTAAAGLFGW